MTKFTLSTVLNSIKRHLLVTIALFVVTYWLLHSFNVIDNKFMMKKTVVVGTYTPGYDINFLNFEEMYAIITSPNMSQFLSNTLGSNGVAQYALSVNKIGNMVLVLKSHNPDNLVNTANQIMNRLVEFDELSIQKKISWSIDKPISDMRELLQLISLSGKSVGLSNEDIEKYAYLQKIYDAAYEGGSIRDIASLSGISINTIIELEQTVFERKAALNQQKMKINNDIERLESLKRDGFTTVSYLYPAERSDAIKYFPNSMIFFGISLLVAFFYNLIMLTSKYNKVAKQT